MGRRMKITPSQATDTQLIYAISSWDYRRINKTLKRQVLQEFVKRLIVEKQKLITEKEIKN
jgi:hypothetical protein